MKRYYFRAKYFLLKDESLSIEDNLNTDYNYWYVEDNIIYRNYDDLSEYFNHKWLQRTGLSKKALGEVSDYPIVSKALNMYLIKKRKLKLSKI